MSRCQHDDCDREGIAAWNGCVFCDEHVRERLRTAADTRPPETGESTLSIQRRQDDLSWSIIEMALKAGGELWRPIGLSNYYSRGLPEGDFRNGRCLSAARVKRLVADGVIKRAGADVYVWAAETA